MKRRGIGRRLTAWLTAAVLALSCFGGSALAYETIDTDRKGSLTVYFGQDGSGFSGVGFSVYQIAEVSRDARFSLTGAFAEYPVSLEGLDSSGWRALAQTLAAYAARDGLEPMETVQTGEDGRARFAGLAAGLYLITGERFQQDHYTYTPEPFVVSLPSQDPENGGWLYDVASACKYESQYHPPGSGDTVTRKVLKVWRDDGREHLRPEAITVQLLQDGAVYDTVTLNAENNWRHTWTELDGDSSWQVAEAETPAGYRVSVSREGITFVMTNTRRPEGGGSDNPPPPDNPPSSDNPPSPEDFPPLDEIPEEPVPQGLWPWSPGAGTWQTGTLPQTGVLWWPVPILMCAGLALLLIGWGKRRQDREDG